MIHLDLFEAGVDTLSDEVRRFFLLNLIIFRIYFFTFMKLSFFYPVLDILLAIRLATFTKFITSLTSLYLDACAYFHPISKVRSGSEWENVIGLP